MKLEDFVDALYGAGWVASNDAQHNHIRKVWKQLKGEDKLLRAENELMAMRLWSALFENGPDGKRCEYYRLAAKRWEALLAVARAAAHSHKIGRVTAALCAALAHPIVQDLVKEREP